MKIYGPGFWSERRLKATELAERRRDSGATTALVVASAIHPLVLGGMLPGTEFKAHLTAAARKREALVKNGVVGRAVIYVPGSRHGEDKVPLAYAGTRWLRSQGVTDFDLHGVDWNEKFGPESGVYCGSDEAYAAQGAVAATESIGALAVIGSRRQLPRLKQHYVAYAGLPPEMIATERVDGERHGGVVNYATELALRAYTSLADPFWEGSMPDRVRDSRQPVDPM